MQPRILLAVAAGIVLAGIAGVPARAQDQNEAPFTIRFPPDGASVREKVNIRIPLNGIPVGGYVSLYIDGDFRGALSVSDDERKAIQKSVIAAALKAKDKKELPAYFEYVWDTKAPVRQKYSTKETVPPDGQHTILAKLYVPRGSQNGGSDLKESSSVNVIVANKIDPGNIGPLKLNYKFVDGSNSDYKRTGIAAVVAGLSQGMTGTGDQELVSFKSDHVLGVEDVYKSGPSAGDAVIRNKMRRLEVRQGTSVSFFPSEQLPNSLYQELDPFGNVVYQNVPGVSFEQFAQLGIPVSSTLELPVLPKQSISVGEQWTTDGKLEIPGTPPDQQPKVTLMSKFEGFEWEGGFQTAHIHQSFDSTKGGFKEKQIIFGTVNVMNPVIKYDQDIFVAYRSGKLIKVSRKIEVVGKTAQSVGGGGAAMGAGAPGGSGMMMGGGGGMSSGAGAFAGGGGGTPYGAGGGPPPNMYGGMRSGGAPGGGGTPYGAGGGPPPNMYGGGGQRGRGAAGRGGGGMAAGGLGSGGMMGKGGGGGFQAGGGGFQGGGAAFQGNNPSAGLQQITLKSTTITELNQTQTAMK